MTQKQEEILFKLLQEVRAEAATGRRPWPSERTFRLASGINSLWATELVILKPNDRENATEIFLTPYEGGIEEYRGMLHIPGGYDSIATPDIATTCNMVAQRELGVAVEFCGVLDAIKWRPGQHPYGRPLSLFCHCAPRHPYLPYLKEEGQRRRFYRFDEVDEQNIVLVHLEFIVKHFFGV